MASKFRREQPTLVADIEDIITVSEARMTALMRQSLQDAINIMQEPTGKGGNMRVDTGFLRASGQASLTGMPTGPVRGDKTEKDSYPSPDDYRREVTLGTALDKMEIGNTFFFGWTANYAVYREIYDGFMERGLQQWGRIVAFNTDAIRERIKK